MDNVGIVVESLDETIAFFSELGLKPEGRTTIKGEWAGRVTGLGYQHVEIAMMVTPDGHSRLEISRFLTPTIVADHRNDPVNALEGSHLTPDREMVIGFVILVTWHSGLCVERPTHSLDVR